MPVGQTGIPICSQHHDLNKSVRHTDSIFTQLTCMNSAVQVRSFFRPRVALFSDSLYDAKYIPAARVPREAIYIMRVDVG